MNPLKKFKNRRGMTLIEVLCVVTLMSVMLAVAMPDILTESAKMKLTAMDNNARAVAVAVQSKLYSMKNSEYASTNEGDDYALLRKAAFTVENSAGGSESAGGESSKEEGDGSGSEGGESGKGEEAAGGSEGGGSGKEEESGSEGESGTDADEKKYISNFAIPGNSEETNRAMLTAVKNYLFNSLGMTDIGLLEHGKILIVFNPKTADVTEVFYSENEFALTGILPAPNGKFLEDNVIGYYHGTGGAEIVREKDPVQFLVSGFDNDPELVFKIEVVGDPPEEIMNMPLGIEVFIKNETTPEKKAVGEVCIYSEGIFTKNYETDFVTEKEYKTILPDDYLTFKKIKENGGMLKFGLDSPLTSKVINWDSNKARQYLTHVAHPELISMATDSATYGLFPRETLGDWLNRTKNPFLTVWFRQHADLTVGKPNGDGAMSQEMYNMITDGDETKLSSFFEAKDIISLRVVIHGLKKDGDSVAVDSTNQNIRVFDDNAYYEIKSQSKSPYFYNILDDATKIEIRSYRELNNLHYVFEQDNEIKHIEMSEDITFEDFYNLSSDVKKKLIAKSSDNINSIWTFANLGDSFIVDSINTKDKFNKFNNGGFRPFTFDGQGHTIEGVVFGNDNYGNGLFMVAKGCTFENLNIVNTKVWNRSLSSGNFIQTGDSNIDIKWPSYNNEDFQVGGSLVSVAIDCKFTNVRAVINKDKLLATYEPENEKAILDNIPLHRVSNVIAGGLVGAAFGTDGLAGFDDGTGSTSTGTCFINCASSMRVLADNNAAGQVCAYAGGLIGVAVGNVNISYSYAAGQLAGYRSGGLIGATFERGKFVDDAGNNNQTTLADVSSGTTKITNSFTAGQIMRTVREGAGLIAQINGTTPDVKNCYSATWWESLPPVAYGTFKGDQDNFFVYQTLVEMPVTVNVAALFKYSGAKNVFSSQNTTDAAGENVYGGGIPCTVEELNKKLLPEGGDVSPELSFGSWQKATATSRWTMNGASDYLSDNATDYPFPIPSHKENNAEQVKTEFYGDWIKSDARDEAPPAAAVEEFKEYYYLYFSNTDGASSKADPCMIHQKNVKLSIKDNKVYLSGYYKNAWWNTCEKYPYGTVSYSLKEILDGGYYYWANLYGYQEVKDNVIDGKIPDIPNKTPNLNFKYDGDAAKTEVSVSGTDFVFRYAPYYDKDFEPLNPFKEVTKWTEGNSDFKLGNSTLCWDFYGYYFMADYTSYITEVKYKKYYIKFDNTITGNNLSRGKDENDGYIYVNKDSFENALKFETKTLSSTNVKPSWDREKGVFSVENK